VTQHYSPVVSQSVKMAALGARYRDASPPHDCLDARLQRRRGIPGRLLARRVAYHGVSQNREAARHRTRTGRRPLLTSALQFASNERKQFSIGRGDLLESHERKLPQGCSVSMSVLATPDSTRAVHPLLNPKGRIDDPAYLAKELVHHHSAPPGPPYYSRRQNLREKSLTIELAISCTQSDVCRCLFERRAAW
jgi:hypothetical protein